MIITKGELKTMTVRCEGDRVELISGGRLVASMPAAAADALARALVTKAREADEQANALKIIHDGAILTRLGVPIGLTNRRDMQKEIAKEAAWNSDLRRYLPGGVKSKETFGTPSVTRHDPPKGKANNG